MNAESSETEQNAAEAARHTDETSDATLSPPPPQRTALSQTLGCIKYGVIEIKYIKILKLVIIFYSSLLHWRAGCIDVDF